MFRCHALELRTRLVTATIVLALGAACSSDPKVLPMPQPSRGVTRAPFGTLADGTAIELFTLTNAHGVEVKAVSYGGIIVSIRVPDRAGALGDVVLGHETLQAYVADNSPYLGAIVGRYGNRIAQGRFTLDGRVHQLTINDGPNHLHGGRKGFDKVAWVAEPVTGADGAAVRFTRTSPAGEEGYPGALAVSVTYTLTDANTLAFDYEATTDAPTIVNLTQHTYFNLAGQRERAGDGPAPLATILDHVLQIAADRYTPVDATLIPTGELAPVEGTPFDFREGTPIGARIGADHEQLRRGRGYDHNWVLTRAGDGLAPAARLVEPTSGRTLEVATTEPGIQFYSGNFLDGSITGKGVRALSHRSGLCLETQHFPDSPNQPAFPSTVLRPGDTYRSRTVLTFGVQR